MCFFSCHNAFFLLQILWFWSVAFSKHAVCYSQCHGFSLWVDTVVKTASVTDLMTYFPLQSFSSLMSLVFLQAKEATELDIPQNVMVIVLVVPDVCHCHVIIHNHLHWVHLNLRPFSFAILLDFPCNSFACSSIQSPLYCRVGCLSSICIFHFYRERVSCSGFRMIVDAVASLGCDTVIG